MVKEKTIFIGIVFHFHQPIDNFDHVIEDCYQKAYLPLITNMFNFPKLKFTLHFSGNILQWFLDKKPDLIEKLRVMSKRNQIEIIGGGFYEPIYAIIPDRDKIAQMEKLAHLIKKQFQLEVKGAWLSERVWEPHYPSFLNEAGLKYVIVDDNHFRSCGLTEVDTLYTYNTEDQGNAIRIFPINEQIRYLIPWKPSFNTMNYLKELVDEEGNRIAIMLSDAEKMGVWGSTHEICYVDGSGHVDGDGRKPFIPTLFSKIVENDWLKSITLSEYMQNYPAKELIYLPTASYDKMEEWALPTPMRRKFEKLTEKYRNENPSDEIIQFLHGGFWRYFLVKYPESNNMHKKMMHVREKLIEIEKVLAKRIDKSTSADIQESLKAAWEEIYKAQCNDAYWHGLFGGVYLQFLRFANYTHLINAEKIIDEINGKLYPVGDYYITILPKDFTKNSKMELLIESTNINAYFDPQDGGTLFELDYKPKSYNLLNTLTRWLEAYHDEEKIQNNEIIIDQYRKNMLRIRFFEQGNSIFDLNTSTYQELGDFVNGPFQITKNEKEVKAAILKLKREGNVQLPHDGVKIPCEIVKKILIEENRILVAIKGTFGKKGSNNEEISKLCEQVKIAVDLPFFFNGDTEEFSWESTDLISSSESNSHENLLDLLEYKGSDFTAHDNTYDLEFKIMISSNNEDIRIGKYPIIARAYTEDGYKDIYQGICVVPMFFLSKDFEIQLNFVVK